MRVTSTNRLHHLGAALLNSTIHLGIVNSQEEKGRDRERGIGSHRPIHETLMNVRGGSSGFNGVARFDLPKVDSGKSGETSGACLPTGRDHRVMMEEVG
ncbi:hypothetical protein ALC57_13011 [Trachymyrmex cornetzi]|uniref:Uncharacterized protein n=1 Tax=Trachymyrmex cornetzi TaxID=471704 RepID=A0A151J036_9HYME|nr:hypothetical protein ALC57_13011 [Trachymyrmex cornetzi]